MRVLKFSVTAVYSTVQYILYDATVDNPACVDMAFVTQDLSVRFFNSCRRLPETKRHSSLFLY